MITQKTSSVSQISEQTALPAATTYDVSRLNACGEDVFISPLVSIVRPELVTLGKHVAIDPYFHCTTRLETGDHVHISAHVAVIGGKTGVLRMGHFTNISVGGRIVCGSDGFLGEGIVSAPGIPEEYRDTLTIEPVVFEDFANTGANVTILPGVRLGEGSVVGACSLVTEDTEPWTIYVGTPARPLKVRDRSKILEYAKRMGYR